MAKCVQLNAPWVKCCIRGCKAKIKTCLPKRRGKCPVHEEGYRFIGNRWVCSAGHHELALQQYSLGILK